MAKTFFYTAGGVFFIVASLAIAWSVGQQGSRVVALQAANALYAVTASGEIYASSPAGWIHGGNIRSGPKR